MANQSKMLMPGDPAPWFTAESPLNPTFNFHMTAGRFVALVFLGSASDSTTRAFIDAVAAGAPARADVSIRYAVVTDRAKFSDPGILAAFPGQRIFFDPEGKIAALYALAATNAEAGKSAEAGGWYVMDPSLRVVAAGPLGRPDAFVELIRRLPHPDHHAGPAIAMSAPVLLVPRVLEPALCKAMIEAYKSGTPTVSGFMRTVGGKTVGAHDPNFKRRMDLVIEDRKLCDALTARIRRRLVPEIKKAFQFRATRIERFIVACYDDQSHGFFKPHRDNTTAGTAHRRFAVTINLNAEEYEGGDLRFPEFGTRTYRAPTGGAVVFSCSLLHEAMPVLKGVRYATLPFLYDDAAAEIRAENLQFIDQNQSGDLASAIEEPTPG